jgi:hypothetical protein
MATFLEWPLTLGPDAASYAVFSGSPDIEASLWNATDRMGYRKVTGTIIADKGGLVYVFVIPDGVTGIREVSVTGKLGTASQNIINIRVKDQDGTLLTGANPSASITAATVTTATVSSFSLTAAATTAGNRIIVEVEGDVDVAETAFLGGCVIKFSRRP